MIRLARKKLTKKEKPAHAPVLLKSVKGYQLVDKDDHRVSERDDADTEPPEVLVQNEQCECHR